MSEQQSVHSESRSLSDYAWLGAILLFLATGRILRYESPDKIVLPLLGWPLPDSCWSRSFIGVQCPGCGLTRSVVMTLHGNWLDALQLHVVGPLLVAWAIFQFVARLLRMVTARAGELGGWAISSQVNIGFVVAALALCFVQWLSAVAL